MSALLCVHVHVRAHGLGTVFGAETGYVADVLDLDDVLPGFAPTVCDLFA